MGPPWKRPYHRPQSTLPQSRVDHVTICVLVFVNWPAGWRRWHRGAHMSVTTWWLALIGVSLVNICAWVLAGVLPVRRAVADPALATRRRQLLLSAPFVFGCAFRSVFPRADVQRICVVDSWLSSVAVGRTVATIAEVCFAAQCALLLRVLALEARTPVGARHLARDRSAHRDGRDVLLVRGRDDQLPRQHDGGIDLGPGGDAADRRASIDGSAAPAGSTCARSSARRSGSRRLRRVHVHDRRADVLRPLAQRHGRRRRTTCRSRRGFATRRRAGW